MTKFQNFLERMGRLAFVFEHGHTGVEECHYEPEECPFGEWCDCKTYLEEGRFDG